jgi:hypothetical protein
LRRYLLKNNGRKLKFVRQACGNFYLLKTVFSERTILFLLASLTPGWKDDAKRERRKEKNWNEKEINRKESNKGTGITKINK